MYNPEFADYFTSVFEEIKSGNIGKEKFLAIMKNHETQVWRDGYEEGYEDAKVYFECHR